MQSIVRGSPVSPDARSRRLPRSLLLLGALLLIAGCERPFDPIATSDVVFSIYGHLDAAQDTQWVRVAPIRESLTTLPEAIDAVVTLEEMETGATVVMSDSLTRYLSVNLDEVVYAHNYSTTMPMVPGRHYRLTATRSDGAASSATVLVPAWQSPTLVANHAFAFPTTTNPANIGAVYSYGGTISGTRHLGMVFGGRNFAECCEWRRPIPEEFLPVTRPAEFEGDDHGVQLDWSFANALPSWIGTRLGIKGKWIIAIASGEEWPYGASMQLREVSHPAAINTIEGGVGFLAGVHTYVFPFAGCTPLERNIPCTITFSPSSANLIAVVTNGCTGGPLPDARVQLLGSREDGIRLETTGANGKVQFPGMKPGAAHSLSIETPVPPGKQMSDFFPVEIENVVLGEAEVDTVSIVMTHRENCMP